MLGPGFAVVSGVGGLGQPPAKGGRASIDGAVVGAAWPGPLVCCRPGRCRFRAPGPVPGDPPRPARRRRRGSGRADSASRTGRGAGRGPVPHASPRHLHPSLAEPDAVLTYPVTAESGTPGPWQRSPGPVVFTARACGAARSSGRGLRTGAGGGDEFPAAAHERAPGLGRGAAVPRPAAAPGPDPARRGRRARRRPGRGRRAAGRPARPGRDARRVPADPHHRGRRTAAAGRHRGRADRGDRGLGRRRRAARHRRAGRDRGPAAAGHRTARGGPRRRAGHPADPQRRTWSSTRRRTRRS